MPFETVVLKTVEYLKVPSVVGFENHFLGYLADDFENLGVTIKRHDGLLEISGKEPNSDIISAHVDRHGLISREDGYFTYAAETIRQDKYDEDSIATKKTLEAIQQRFVGEDMIAYDPLTGEILGQGTIRKALIDEKTKDHIFKIMDMPELLADTPVAYGRNAEFLDNHLKGQIDNVVSLGLIYVLFQNGFQGTALLTTEEEIGKSWRHISKWLGDHNVESQSLYIIDTSPYRETLPIDNHWITLRRRDKSGVFNKEMAAKIIERCEALSLPYQIKDQYFLDQGLKISDLGSTELGRLVMETDNRWNGCTIQIPTTEYHTSYETTNKGCIENVYRLLSDLLINNP